jgi:hypothetical protein
MVHFLHWWVVLLGFSVVQGQDRNLDHFNYDTTVRTDTFIDFGPADWGDIVCPDLETCVSIQLNTISYRYCAILHFECSSSLALASIDRMDG